MDDSAQRKSENGNFANAATIPEDSMHSRQLYGQDEVEGSERNIGDVGAGSGERICSGTSGTDSPHPDSHRGREVDEHMESELADGAKPVSNGGQRNVADTDNTRLEGRDESGCGEDWKRLYLRRYVAGHGDEGGSEGTCGERWQNFPSVSPVHRGNDGLPFDVDRLTISFGKWRTEALKAYGNAIVPQVMYEIFRAIEQVEQQTSNPI
jgi:DNA (cytosine-5)-methyltransferase 1